MSKFKVTDSIIYRWRYILGYGLLGLMLIGLLIFAALYVPDGLSQSEMDAAVTSDSLSLNSPGELVIANAPFYLLQKASLVLFGVSNLSIKLPSLILSLFSAIGLIFLLRRWFKPGIAVLASVIAITTGQFLLVAQTGSIGILYLFWPILLLLLATFVAKRKKPRTLWKIVFFIAAAISLYTPLSLYILIALGSAVALHPHLRYLFKQLSKIKLLAGFVVAALVIAPLGWRIAHDPGFGLKLLGIPSQWPNLLANLHQLANEYFGFILGGSTDMMIPVFGMASMALIIIGIYQTAKSRATVQSYLVITWSLCLLPVLIINPSHTNILFVPLVLLIATGLQTLLDKWYKLFPLNPYARVAGLLPLVVLVLVLVTSGIDRYVYGYHYSPTAVQGFSQDLTLLPADTKNLVVSNDELLFYNVVAGHRDDLTVTTNAPKADEFTVSQAARSDQKLSGYSIGRIITSERAESADRFYVYKKASD